MKFKGGKRPEGKTKTFTISKDSTGYYASILFDEGKKEIPQQEVSNVLGIDLGIKDFAILSNGKKVKNLRFTKTHERRLRKWQKALSRRIKGSKKREQAKKMVGRIYKKIANQRLDFAHKVFLVIGDEGFS